MQRLTPLSCYPGGLLRPPGVPDGSAPCPPRLPRGVGAGLAHRLIVGASTMTGVFIKFPAGALSDILGRRMPCWGSLPSPFLYLLAGSLHAARPPLPHGFATAMFSPVASAAVADLFREGRGESRVVARLM
jgi:MFS family permease